MMSLSRETIYRDADCFMLCTAVNNRDSLEVVANFNAEIRRVSNKPILLVGTKIDTRTEEANCISLEELEEKCREFNHLDVLETSSRLW